MKTIIHFLIFYLTVLFVGFGSVQKIPLSRENAHVLVQSSVTYTTRKFPSLEVFSTEDATADTIGGAVARASDDKSVNERIKSIDISNPNDLFRVMILEHLREEFQVADISSEGVVFKGKQQQIDLANSEVSTKFIMDSRVSWMCSYLPMNWTRYMFQFHFSVTITDADTETIIYSNHFHWKTPKNIGFPKMKEFFTDENKGIEVQIQAACSDASEHFKSQLLNSK